MKTYCSRTDELRLASSGEPVILLSDAETKHFTMPRNDQYQHVLAVLAMAIPSVCPSVTRWYPIQTNEHRIMRSSL